MISLIIAGGVYMAANAKPTEWPDIDNHTLKGEAIPSSKVVCRDMWGTPMLPNGKGGYSLIAPINNDFIAESLIQPPQYARGMVAYRPLPPVDEAVEVPVIAPVPEPAIVAPPVETAPAPAMVAPADSPFSDASAAPAPATPADAPVAPVTQ